MITYDQKILWPNWCTYVAIVTNLSNLYNIKLSLNELKEWYDYVWLDWWGSLASRMVNKVVEWWEKKFNKKVTAKMYTIQNALERAKNWKMIYIWFRWDIWMYMDTQDNWRIDRVPPKWPKEWWHSCNMIRNWSDYIIIDNYSDRKYKEYEVSEEIMDWLIKNNIMRLTTFIFFKWRIIWLK